MPSTEVRVSLKAGFMKEREWQGVAEGLAASPELRMELERLRGELPGSAGEAFLHAVDESAFPLGQWVEALALFRSWLAHQGLELPAPDRIAYVGCAAESGGSATAFTSLSELVRDFLEANGCERARPKDASSIW